MHADPPLGRNVLEQFGLRGDPTPLPGGSRPVYRVGDVVLKRLRSGSLEHDRSLDLAPWLAEVLASLHQVGFRMPRPLQTRAGRWLAEDNWTAWTYLEGQHATAQDVPACIDAIVALHRALDAAPKHPLLDHNQSVFGRADGACWSDAPGQGHPLLAPLLDALYALRRPLDGLAAQLIHADLNPENILIARGQAPGFLDLTPFWRPPEFAVALFANWIGPRRGDRRVLGAFAGVRAFDQLLIRAGIRMLLIVTDADASFVETGSEAQAARIILDYAASRHT
jgi:Ser/Thr protein kinase RdoA (MazF antagonist)